MNKIGYLFVGIMILVACGSRKKAKKETVQVNPIEIKDTSQSAKDLLQNTLTNWTYFSSKLSIQQDLSPNFNNLNGNIRMYKDSLIWISVSVMGFEGGRILITKDSTIFLDKINSEYTVYNNKSLEKYIGVEANITQLQNLLLSRPIFNLNQYKILNLKPFLSIVFRKNLSEAFHHYSAENSLIDSTVLIDQKNKKYVKVNYFEYTKVAEHNMATQINLLNYQHNITKKSELVLKFLSPDFTSVLTFPINISSNYKRKENNE